MIWLLLAFAGYEVYTHMAKTSTQAAQLPKDPAGRRAAVRGVIARADLGKELEAADKAHGGKVRAALFTQGQLETSDFTSSALAKTNSLLNRHVGKGLGDWLHQTYVTPSGEPLRVYASMEQGIEDVAQHLLSDPLYVKAKAALLAGNAQGYFQAVTDGNGKTGYVGDPTAPKAKNYVAALNRIWAAGAV